MFVFPEKCGGRWTTSYGGELPGGRAPQLRVVRQKRTLLSRRAHISAPVGAMAPAGTVLGATGLPSSQWAGGHSLLYLCPA